MTKKARVRCKTEYDKDSEIVKGFAASDYSFVALSPVMESNAAHTVFK